MKTNIKKKIIILLTLYLSLLLSPKVDNDHNIEFRYKDSVTYTDYSNGKVYISSLKRIRSIYNEDSTNIYIIDQRNIKDSNIEILDSYKISSKHEMEEIINILLEYERINPSSWDRSYDSLLNEWLVHNICYQFNYDEISTKHVDLNNSDETKYNSKELTRILGNK